MDNMVRFFGQSAFHISHWPNCMLLRFEKHLWRKLTSLKYYVLFSVNPPSIYLIDRKFVTLITLAYFRSISRRYFWLTEKFVTLITLAYVGFANPSQLFFYFGNLFGNFFRSITQSTIRSIRLRSTRSVFYDWPNFFSRSRLRSIRTKSFRSRLTEGHSVNWKFGQ